MVRRAYTTSEGVPVESTSSLALISTSSFHSVNDHPCITTRAFYSIGGFVVEASFTSSWTCFTHLSCLINHSTCWACLTLASSPVKEKSSITSSSASSQREINDLVCDATLTFDSVCCLIE